LRLRDRLYLSRTDLADHASETLWPLLYAAGVRRGGVSHCTVLPWAAWGNHSIRL